MDRRAFVSHIGLTSILGLSGVSTTVIADELPVIGFLRHAHAQTRSIVIYDSGYSKIGYPMGDVAADKGVCSDVIIRAYRAIGIDLQRLVHEDMVKYFTLYPKKWGLRSPDSNIDHRRVPNLRVFFGRFANSLAISTQPKDYKAGDLVTYRLPFGQPHIAIVSDEMSFFDHTRPLIIHNIGAGPKLEDALFSYKITDHFRYKV